MPLAGDFDGDGCDSVSIWRPSQARVYIINRLGTDGGGLGAADFDFGLGNPGDRALVGDFDGDGLDTVAIYRTSAGAVYIFNSLEATAPDDTVAIGSVTQVFAGDWNGDGADTIGFYDGATVTLLGEASPVVIVVGSFSGVSPL